MTDDVELHAVQLPGRAERINEAPLTRMSELVSRLGPRLAPLLDLPFAFFGHSMGAILSFEVARWLRANRAPLPKVLVVSGRRAPHVPDHDPPRYLMNDRELIAEIQKLNATSGELLTHPEFLELILPSLRADFELCETYEYRPSDPLTCPITALYGADDEDETLDRVKEWQFHTTATFSFREMQGDHFFIHGNVKKILDLIQTDLN